VSKLRQPRTFKAFVFLLRLTLARMSEISGKWDTARATLNKAVAPQGYAALRDAYDARLASIQYAEKVARGGLEHNPADDVSRLIASLKAHAWYSTPRDENEHYAARYLDYLEAAVLGDQLKREAYAQELNTIEADRFDRQVLRVT
jgi:hypothetical protein